MVAILFVDKGISMVNAFHDMGYETTLNIMAVSRDRGPELDEALHQVQEECKADVLYLVDSFGAFYQEDIDKELARYKSIVKNKKFGFHGHNNQQLAFSNTIQAIINHVDYLDGSVSGMGRGAGNCTTELLLSFLKNPKYDLRPVLDAIEELFLPLQSKYEWGYIIPQMITGMLNRHPQDAIAVRKTEEKDMYRKFYEHIIFLVRMIRRKQGYIITPSDPPHIVALRKLDRLRIESNTFFILLIIEWLIIISN